MMLGTVDHSNMSDQDKMYAFVQAVAMLGETLEIHPADFVMMLHMITETAEEALGECTCGNCNTPQNATKH